MAETMPTTERLRRIAETWSGWIGPKGDEQRYKNYAATLNEALDALTELTELRAKLAWAEAWAERYSANANLSSAAQLRAEAQLAAATKRANSLETLIQGLHFEAFSDRNYVYSGPQETVELVIADLKATQKERDAATERAEKAEALLDHLQESQQGVYFIPGEDGEDGQFSVGQYSDPDIRKAITASLEAE